MQTALTRTRRRTQMSLIAGSVVGALVVALVSPAAIQAAAAPASVDAPSARALAATATPQGPRIQPRYAADDTLILTGTINVGDEPRGLVVSPDGSVLYVANSGSDSVSVIDTNPASGTYNTVLATIPVGDYPIGLALSPDGSRLYVGNAGSDNVSIINTGTRTVIASVRVEDYPMGVALSPGGDLLYVTNLYSSNPNSSTVSIINTGNLDDSYTRNVGQYPWGVAVLPNGRAYISNYGNSTTALGSRNAVSVIDDSASGFAYRETITVSNVVDDNLMDVAATPNGNFVYVAASLTARVYKIDVSSSSPWPILTNQLNTWGVAADDSAVYVAAGGNGGLSPNGNVITISTSNNAFSAPVSVGSGPQDVAMAPAGTGQFVYVGNSGSDTVSVLQPAASPVNTLAPAVTGSSQVGQTLTATSGTWTGVPAPTYSYLWQSCTTSNCTGGTVAPIGTDDTVVLTAAEAGKYVRVAVSGTSSTMPAGVASSAPQLVEASGPVSFTSGAFPSVVVGASTALTATVTNAGGAALVPTSIGVTGGGVSITGGTCAVSTPIAPAGSCSVALAWTPASTGSLSGAELTIGYLNGASPSGSLTLSGAATSPIDPTVSPPSAPIGLAGLPGDASVVVTWSAPASPGSFPVSSYELTSSPGGHSCLTAALSCRVSDLANGTAYTFRARALNGAGWGPWSAASESVTPSTGRTVALLISGTRVKVSGKPAIRVTGTASGLDQRSMLRPWMRFPGQASFAEGAARVLVDDRGRFLWERMTGRKIYVFLQTEDGKTRSNRITISAE